MALVQIDYRQSRLVGVITGKTSPDYYVVESGDKRMIRHRDLIKPLDESAVSMLK